MTRRLSYDRREKTVATVVRALTTVTAALEALHKDSMHPDRCGSLPENAEPIARAATLTEAALTVLRGTLPDDAPVPGVITFTVDLKALNAALDRAGKPFHVSEEQVRAAGMQVAEPSPCPCACNSGGQCGGCRHVGCGGRRQGHHLAYARDRLLRDAAQPQESCPSCTYTGTPDQADEHRASGVHNDEPQAGGNRRHQ